MTAAGIWIGLPAVVGLLIGASGNRYPWSPFAGLAVSAGLALAGIYATLDEAIVLGPVRVLIHSEQFLLGRSFLISHGLLRVFGAGFGAFTLWGIGAQALKAHRLFVPAGLIATAFLCASLAVQPWQFAGIFILLAVLVLVLLLSPPGVRPSGGVLNFVAFQAIGIPFLIIAGTRLEGLESIPAGLSLTLQPGIFLGLCFIFLLAIFPFHGWIPGLTEENDPISVGFILVLLPGFIGVLGLQLIGRYAFLRNAPEFFTLLRTVGILSITAGGALVLVQRHAGRLLGYAALIETGMLLIAAGSGPESGARLFFSLFAARSGGFLVWSAALSGLRKQGISLRFSGLGAALAGHPVFSVAVLLGTFSAAGFPLLAGFPARLRLAAALSEIEPTAVFAIWIGMAAMAAAGVRLFAAMLPHPAPASDPAGPAQNPEPPPPAPSQASIQIFLAAGCILLLVFGLFPGWITWLEETMPLAFERLVR